MLMNRKKLFSVLAVLLLLSAASFNAAASASETVIVYTQTSIARFISTDALIKIGVGLLAFLLLVISAIVYYRDRRTKFLILMLAFLIFTLKGVLGLMDFIFPRESSILIPFSDSFDFLILLLFFIAVMKD